MVYEKMLKIVVDLTFDQMTEVYSTDSYSVLILRPSKLSERFKKYDVNTNFQIFLKIGDAEPFRPNHLRMLIDLKLSAREYPKYNVRLLFAFDEIFYGADPIVAVAGLKNIEYTQHIDPLNVTAVLAQLFIIEQTIGYGRKSKFNPPSLYIQGWIRTFIDSEQEIVQIVYRIARNTPPAVKYTCQDNKNHKKYNPSAKSLWYK